MHESANETTQIEQSRNSGSVLERLTAYAEACEKKGIFPYDGRWLSADEIDEQIRGKHLKSRIQMLELGSLFALIYVFVISLGLLLSVFTY